MMGTEGEGRGVTPRLCEELFVRIAQKESLPDDLKKTTYSVKISFLEIYNEKVQDLLSKKSTDRVCLRRLCQIFRKHCQMHTNPSW